MEANNRVFRELGAWVAVIVICESLALFMPAGEMFLRFTLMLAGAAALGKLISQMADLATGKVRQAKVPARGWTPAQRQAARFC